MARTHGDSWDLASSVGATATLVATGRAIASTHEHGLIDDPFAAPLVRAVGIEAFTKMVDGELDLAVLDAVAPDAAARARANIDEMAVRTRFFDDYFTAAAERGIASGDVILDVAGTPVSSPAEVRDSLAKAAKDNRKAVLMRVKSDKGTRFVAISLKDDSKG